MVNIKLKYNFVETPPKFIITKLSICNLGSSSVLIIMIILVIIIISTEEDPSLQIKSFAINLGGVSTKLYFNEG